jgi:hypothetical protein
MNNLTSEEVLFLSQSSCNHHRFIARNSLLLRLHDIAEYEEIEKSIYALVHHEPQDAVDLTHPAEPVELGAGTGNSTPKLVLQSNNGTSLDMKLSKDGRSDTNSKNITIENHLQNTQMQNRPQDKSPNMFANDRTGCFPHDSDYSSTSILDHSGMPDHSAFLFDTHKDDHPTALPDLFAEEPSFLLDQSTTFALPFETEEDGSHFISESKSQTERPEESEPEYALDRGKGKLIHQSSDLLEHYFSDNPNYTNRNRVSTSKSNSYYDSLPATDLPPPVEAYPSSDHFEPHDTNPTYSDLQVTKRQIEKEKINLDREKLEFRKEKKQFEEWRQMELNQIEQDKLKLKKEMIFLDTIKKNQSVKKDKKELDDLKIQVAELQGVLKSKDSKAKLTEDRLRQRIDELTALNQELNEELHQVELDRTKSIPVKQAKVTGSILVQGMSFLNRTGMVIAKKM